MTNFSLNGVAGHIHTLPIRAVSIFSSYLDKALHFYKLEAESSYKFSAIKTNRTNGDTFTIGHNVEVNLYILYNDFTKVYNGIVLQELLKQFRNQRVRVQLVIGNKDEWSLRDDTVDLNTNLLEANNSTSGNYLDFGEKLTFNYDIESVEMRPRLIINMTGVVRTIDNFNAVTEIGNNYLFN